MKSKGTARIDNKISEIVQKHLDLDRAVKLFGDFAKVGGSVFRERMNRVRRAVLQARKAA
jgi:hypothetical protein